MKKHLWLVVGLLALAFAGVATATTPTLFYKHVVVTPASSVCSHTTPQGTSDSNKFSDPACHDHSNGNGNSWHYTLVSTPASTTTTCNTTSTGATSGPYSNSNCTTLYVPPTHGHHHHHGDDGGCQNDRHLSSYKGEGGDECGPPPPPDACLNIEGYQATVPVGYTANSDHICTKIVVTTQAAPPAPELPNAVAFCYGTGANSFVMITPAVFKVLTTSLVLTITINPDKTETSSYAPAWTTGFMASYVKGSGFTCAKGTPTGRYYDTSGEDVTAGYPTAVQNWGETVKDANGVPVVAEWYRGITVP